LNIARKQSDFKTLPNFRPDFASIMNSFSTAHLRFHYIFKHSAGSLLQTLAFRANFLLIMQFALASILLQGTGAEKADPGYYQQ
jgi:hypothetical protein